MFEPKALAPIAGLADRTDLAAPQLTIRRAKDFALVRLFPCAHRPGLATGKARLAGDHAVFRIRREEYRIFGARVAVDQAARELAANDADARLLEASAGFCAIGIEGERTDHVIASLIALDPTLLAERGVIRTRVGSLATTIWQRAPDDVLFIFEAPYADHMWRLLREVST